MSRDNQGLSARKCAYDLIEAVFTEDAYSNLLLPELIDEYELDSRDAGFATELSLGSLRWRGFLDAVIAQASGREVERIDPPIRDILRLGAYQILMMRVPDHAAVSSSVDLANWVRITSASGLVNAVLRRISEKSLDEWVDIVTEGIADDADRLAVRWSHPRWEVTALRDALGAASDTLPQLLETNNSSPSITGVSRSGDAGVAELLDAGGSQGRWSPYAVRITKEPRSLEGIRQGRLGVQDEGSQLVALTAAFAPIDGSDKKWLDLCAGPGGKAALLKYLAHHRGATLTAVELQQHRATLVEKSLAGVVGESEVIVADGTDLRFATGDFDRVIVDAPCTGLGVVRRRAESRWRRTPADVGALTKIQRNLVLNALKAIRPGGVVMYSTCSPHLAETEFVIEDVLAADKSARLLNATEVAIPGLHNADEYHQSIGTGPFIRLWPHVHGTDGMFMALLTRD